MTRFRVIRKICITEIVIVSRATVLYVYILIHKMLFLLLYFLFLVRGHCHIRWRGGTLKLSAQDESYKYENIKFRECECESMTGESIHSSIDIQSYNMFTVLKYVIDRMLCVRVSKITTSIVLVYFLILNGV